MKAFCLLLSVTLSCCCSAQGVPLSNQPAAVATGVITSPVLLDNDPAPPNKGGSKPAVLIQDQQQEAEVLDLLKQLVLVQKEVAGGQVQVVQKLSALEKQGSQLIQDLQNMARHHSLLVENNQALLLQTSRIAVFLQETTKKAPDTSQ